MKNKRWLKIAGDISFYFIASLLLLVVLCQVGVFPFRFVYIRSGSMSPVFNTGDMAVIRMDTNFKPNPGDIIMFTDGGGDVVHRVIDVSEKGITTKGDANNAVDTTTKINTKGIYLFHIPLLGYVFVFIQNNIFLIIMFLLIGILLYVLKSYGIFPFKKKQKV